MCVNPVNPESHQIYISYAEEDVAKRYWLSYCCKEDSEIRDNLSYAYVDAYTPKAGWKGQLKRCDMAIIMLSVFTELSRRQSLEIEYITRNSIPTLLVSVNHPRELELCVISRALSLSKLCRDDGISLFDDRVIKLKIVEILERGRL